MSDLQITRNVEFLDNLRVARVRSLPNLGPRLLFFSDGSALNEIARALKLYTDNSIHLITPFDSGGSSQVLRDAFGMPTVCSTRQKGQPHLLFCLDQRKEGDPDRKDQNPIEERHCAGVEDGLKRRQIGDGELCRSHCDHTGPDDPSASCRSPGQGGAIDVADEKQVEDLKHDKGVHRYGLSERGRIAPVCRIEIHAENCHQDQR